ncbi:MAG: BrnT family toxin [Patescibacteria group bacterium]|nr:BrnT family toxin [Patescibacteria group bacterium]
MIKFSKIIGFDWDNGNILKNWDKHKVKYKECEEIFFNKPLIIANDKSHSNIENRYHVLGKTSQNRFLFLSFTVRKNKIRVISARNMNKKESKIYVK